MKLKEKLAKEYSEEHFLIGNKPENTFIAGFNAAKNLVIETLLMVPLNLAADKIRHLGEEEV